MPKINRWRAGLKSGNRRERDMTASSFNQEFLVTNKSTAVDNTTGNWRLRNKEATSLTDNPDALGIERYEKDTWKERADVSESLDTDDIEIIERGKGMRYTKGSNTSFRMVRSSSRTEGNVIFGNPLSQSLLYANAPPVWYKPLGFSFSDRTPGASDTLTTTSINIDVPTTNAGFYKDLKLKFNTPGVPFRFIVTNSLGTRLYESQSDYTWDTKRYKNNTVSPVTHLVSLDAYYVETGDVLKFQWDFATPVEVVGINTPGGFLPALEVEYSAVEKIPMGATGDISKGDLCEYQHAARDNATPHSMHNEDGCIILNDEGEYIEWFNELGTLSAHDRLCNYEWAMRHASPNSIHSEVGCIMLTQDDEYIEWEI